MTRKEIIEFLNEEYGCRKTDMKTIKEMSEVALSVGYEVIKNGVEDYELHEVGVIIDFTKPLKINRDIPALANNKMYNGVPISLICEMSYFLSFNNELWCYLMNKKDGDIIHFDEILNANTLWCKSNESIVKNLDVLTYLGFMKEKKDCIEVYAYPITGNPAGPYKYRNNETTKRFAPFKFVN